MNRSWLVAVLLVSSCALLLAGCTAPPKPVPVVYGPGKPGPWQNVTVLVNFNNDRVTIEVKDFPIAPNNYVRKFSLTDQRGVSVGERVFALDNTPKETFILSPDSKRITVSVQSSGQGEWRSAPCMVPESVIEKKEIVPPSVAPK